MKVSEISMKSNNNNGQNSSEKPSKPHFRPAQDDTKPVLQDPVLSISLSLSKFLCEYLSCTSFHLTWVFHILCFLISFFYVYVVPFILSYINIENFQYCRGFWRYNLVLLDQLLSLSIFVWVFHFMFFDISLCVSSSIHFLFLIIVASGRQFTFLYQYTDDIYYGVLLLI